MPDRPQNPPRPERLTARALPAYRHIPRRTPHPIRSPEGHSYRPDGEIERELPDLNRACALDHEEFRYGVDLFNEGYWWECHEVMEAFWHSSGPGSPAGHVLQAIIQCAAAHLKQSTGQANGARKLLAMADSHVQRAETTDLGLDLVRLIAETGAFLVEDPGQPARLALTDPI